MFDWGTRSLPRFSTSVLLRQVILSVLGRRGRETDGRALQARSRTERALLSVLVVNVPTAIRTAARGALQRARDIYASISNERCGRTRTRRGRPASVALHALASARPDKAGSPDETRRAGQLRSHAFEGNWFNPHSVSHHKSLSTLQFL